MLALSLFGVVLSMIIIWRASDGFEAASSYIGRNLSDGVRGATINAIGSSLPELFTTITALLFYMDKDGFAFGIGTTAGSAIFNSAVIPSLVILTVVLTKTAKRVIVSKKVILRDGISLLVCEMVLILLLSKGELTWMDGLLLLGSYASYVCILFLTMEKSDEKQDEDDAGAVGQNDQGVYAHRFMSFITLDIRGGLLGLKRLTTAKAWMLLAAASSVIGGACWVLVESCYLLGSSLGIKIYFIAVILAAAATSVPDTILSIKDAKKGNYDDAVSNALGSNIFDICVCLGLPIFIFSILHGPIILDISDGSVAELRVLLILLTGVTFFLMAVGRGLGLFKGLALLCMYIVFTLYIYLRATGHPFGLEIGEFLQSLLSILKT